MLSAVLFDLDGTLIDYRANYESFLRRVADSWDIHDSSDAFFAIYSRSIRAEGAVTFKRSVESALVQTGRPMPTNLDELCSKAVADYAEGIQVREGAVELIGLFSGLPKTIVSNGPSDMQRAALEVSGLAPYFDQVLISGDEDVAVRKPDPAIFLLACSRLGVNPANTLMIGDNHEADIQGARKAGLQAVHVSEIEKIKSLVC